MEQEKAAGGQAHKEPQARHTASPEMPKSQGQTLLVDISPSWVRRPRDLVSAALGLLGIIGVMLLAIYAQSTVVAVVNDAAHNTSTILQTILFFPFYIIEGLISKGYTIIPISKILLDGEYSIDHTGRQFPA